MRFCLTIGLWVACAAQSLSISTPLAFTHRNSPTPQKYLLETMGGGVALLDYNNDGRLDVFLVNGGKASADFGRRDPSYWNRLFRQNNDSSFTDVTAESGLDKSPNAYGMGVATGDFDNDGWIDLYVTGFGANALYRNNRKGGFEDITTAATAVGGWSASAGFFDYDNDGRLDLFVTRYLDWTLEKNILCGTPFNAYCKPDRFPATTNVLLHNEGDGKFRDVSVASGIARVKGKGLGVAFQDYDADGFTDVFVANDGLEQHLFRNRGDGTFAEVGLDTGVAFADDGKPFAGMGVAFDDYDNDGKPDIAVTNLALEKYALFRNEGGGAFRYASATSGLAGVSARSSGWGVKFADFDNDGWKDLFVAQSHVLDNVEKIHSGLRYLEPMALYPNRAGKFEREDLGVPVAARGAAFGDLNNDGSMDVVVSVLGGNPVVLLGKAPAKNRWLIVRGAAVGSRIEAGGVTGYTSTAGSYLSASDSRVHLGLGSREIVDVTVTSPGGRKQLLRGIGTNQILEMR